MRRTTSGQSPMRPDDWSWRLHAACRGVDTAVFYGPDDERPTRKRVREQRAKAICSTCPVLVPCRQHALAAREWYGVWGGLGERERQAMQRGMEQQRAVMR